MAGLSDSQITAAAIVASNEIYVRTNKLADQDLPTMEAAVRACDACMTGKTEDLQTNHPGKTVEKAISDDIQAAAGRLTLQERGIIITAWSKERAGL